jgi:hypothetical protein
MQNIFDYLDWRGDLSFARDGFNEVDNLIVSMLAYLKFDGVVPPDTDGGSITLSKVAEQFKKSTDDLSALVDNLFLKQIPELFMKAAQSVRYRDIELSSYVNQVNHEQSNQFSAVVFSINSKEHFIAFRGTDDTLAGWKEDFQMSFMDEVQAQQDAVIYTEKIISDYDGAFYLGGHSKGGNLAVYAAAHASAGSRNRIIGVYNNDGPGFQTKVLQSDGYQSMLSRINTFIPKSSVIGMLLEHGEEYRIISSDKLGIMQHNSFFWHVRGNHFLHEDGLTKSSSNFNKTVRLWLDQLTMAQREQFIDGLFDTIQAAGKMTVSDISKNGLTVANEMIKTFKNMDPLIKSLLKETIQLFIKEYQEVMKTSIKEDIGSLFSIKKP